MASVPPPYEEINKGPYGNSAPYPPGGAPYPTGGAPYPTGGAPYPNPYQPTYPPAPHQQGQGDQSYNYTPSAPPRDEEYNAGGDNYGNFTNFSDKTIRHAFIKKVYLILTAQLCVTIGFICLFTFHQGIKGWVKRNSWFYYISYATFIITYIVLVCCSGVRRKYPGNFICLSVFTLALSYVTGTISTFYDTPGVLAAASITAVVCISISIFAIQTKIDFTMCSGLILVASVVLLMTGLVCMVIFYTVGYSKVLHGVYAGIAILVFSLYLVYDTQLIIGGRHDELSAEEYISGALQLYMDIVNMFLIILSLFGGRN